MGNYFTFCLKRGTFSMLLLFTRSISGEKSTKFHLINSPSESLLGFLNVNVRNHKAALDRSMDGCVTLNKKPALLFAALLAKVEFLYFSACSVLQWQFEL